MSSRRQFLKQSVTAGAGAALLTRNVGAAPANKPIVVSTWEHGQPANREAWKLLARQARAVDAVEAGVRIPEGDPNVRTVGYGGYPDASGEVTLDACIMDENMNCGSVAYLKQIKHPVSVARLVMDKSPHVMLVGEGAQKFALQHGFTLEELLTPQAQADWQAWKKSRAVKHINIENHDTIGMLALDADGNLSGACTTSGAAYKLPGRVGDSPLIGAGLYVDNDVGAATATGMGELMIKTVGCHLVVELMRQGASPQQACQRAVERIATKLGDYASYQVGFLALNRQGEYGAYCIQPGFNFAVKHASQDVVLDADSLLQEKA